MNSARNSSACHGGGNSGIGGPVNAQDWRLLAAQQICPSSFWELL